MPDVYPYSGFRAECEKHVPSWKGPVRDTAHDAYPDLARHNAMAHVEDIASGWPTVTESPSGARGMYQVEGGPLPAGLCLERYLRCVCTLPKGHDGPHLCQAYSPTTRRLCGGSWDIEGDERVIYAFPDVEGTPAAERYPIPEGTVFPVRFPLSDEDEEPYESALDMMAASWPILRRAFDSGVPIRFIDAPGRQSDIITAADGNIVPREEPDA